MPAMPPARAVPLLRTLRRVTVVMDSSLGDALAGLTPAWIPFQTIGASVIQRRRKFARAQHVVSTLICWCFHPPGAAVVLPSPSEFSPSYRKLGTAMLARRHCRWSQQEIKYWL